jgi:hypothetical protein
MSRWGFAVSPLAAKSTLCVNLETLGVGFQLQTNAVVNKTGPGTSLTTGGKRWQVSEAVLVGRVRFPSCLVNWQRRNVRAVGYEAGR